MSIPQQVTRQRDFSGGEVDEHAGRRDDAPLIRAAARQMSNKRIRATGAASQRPGRRALFAGRRRQEQIRISASETYYIGFGANNLTIRDGSTGAVLSNFGSLPWIGFDVKDVVWDRFQDRVYVCFPGMRPRVLTLDSGAWSIANFAEEITAGGQKRTPFYRFADQGITLTPDDVTGTINITFSDDVLVAGHVGTRMRYHGRQITIASVTNGTTGTATVNERLFPSQRLLLTSQPQLQFSVGDVVEGETSGARGVIIFGNTEDNSAESAVVAAQGSGYSVGDLLEVDGGTFTTAARLTVATETSGAIDTFDVDTPGSYTIIPSNPVTLTTLTGTGTDATADVTWTTTTSTLDVALLTAKEFVDGETIIGPFGEADLQADNAVIAIDPLPSTIWDEEIMNDLKGWPRSVSVDQNRLIFCDFPSLERGISWSAIDAPDNHHPGANPADAFFELINGVGRVYHVVPGDDEFVFSDKGVFYIPISESNPLLPGSVTFRIITTDSASSIRPATTPDGVVFVDEGLGRVVAIRATGQTTKPYLPRDIAEFHSHLITGPVALASAHDDPTIPERYLYLLNRDGTIAVGRYDPNREWIGWVPWTAGGDGAFVWVDAARGGAALFTITYPEVSANPSVNHLTEVIDPAAWLDMQILVNDAPAALAPGFGQGPLWFVANGTVYLMDGDRPMDTRDVDANGFIVAIEGEDLTSANLIAGFTWTETLEPFVPHVQEGRSVHQTLRKRKIGRIAVKATHRTGYVCAGRKIPAWRLGDDLTASPPRREEVHRFRKNGRKVDPRFDIVKDVPGECLFEEVSIEVGV